MRTRPRILFLLLAWIASGWLVCGCYGGPGVEPPFSGESGGEVPSGSLDDGFSPATGEPGSGPMSGGEGEGETSAPDGQGGETWSDGREQSAADGDDNTGGFVPASVVGDAGVSADGGDGGDGLSDAGDAGDPSETEWVQDEMFFE